MLSKSEAIDQLNELGRRKTPFSFYCDFLGEKWSIEPDNSPKKTFSLAIDLLQEHKTPASSKRAIFQKSPPSFESFKKAYDGVLREINFGNSFLTNLTFETPIITELSLESIFQQTSAKYKLYVPGQFVVFSPETFVKIRRGKIYSYPMKGTIDASVENAEEKLLGDAKEKAEHITIVDLIRNDLSQIASNVSVTKFRYLERIHTNEKSLLQVSSEIIGDLPDQWNEQLGDMLTSLLPAGSISGAPKAETVNIIKGNETYSREFYTGICGRFDGTNLDSGVMIRFIKQVNGSLIYCSGGGITSHSNAQKEYQEMIDKVYLQI